MTPPQQSSAQVVLRTAHVVEVTEHACVVWSLGRAEEILFAPQFPVPRAERVSPGHLVAIATAADAREAIVWRWYDAVVLGNDEAGSVRLWEPAHGHVTARPNEYWVPQHPGSRAYASAGLPGAEWWVGGPVVTTPHSAAVELDAVRSLFDDNDMWAAVFG